MQTTGEDWSGVSLTLSTAVPRTDTSIPKLWPSHIRPVVVEKRAKSQSPLRSMKKKKKAKLEQEEVEESDDDMGFGLFDGGEEDCSPPVRINQAGTSCTYGVTGLSNIASDHTWHRVSIAVSPNHA